MNILEARSELCRELSVRRSMYERLIKIGRLTPEEASGRVRKLEYIDEVVCCLIDSNYDTLELVRGIRPLPPR